MPHEFIGIGIFKVIFDKEHLDEASRMSGVTPAAISLLMVHLKKGGFRGFAPDAADAKGEEASA